MKIDLRHQKRCTKIFCCDECGDSGERSENDNPNHNQITLDSVREDAHYSRFGTSVSPHEGKYEALSKVSGREICKG